VFKRFVQFALVMPLFWLASVSAAPALEKSNLDPWLNRFMGDALRVNEIQGAVVVIVKDGKVLTRQGYGHTDAAKQLAVDPQNTVFRSGSVSKLFVWTSIMQLFEQGKIDLDADINRYLDFKIDGKDGQKITTRHLMTHRAGFEEYGKSGILDDPAALQSLSSYVHGHVPERIFTPGSTPAYSNYGAALAGYIVQRVSGLPFETYVERNIFDPLGMTHSSFRQPLPESLRPFMSDGFDLAGGEAKPFELLNDMPAGALSSSGEDMARFMIAHLDSERAQKTTLLKPETASLMHRSVVKNFPNLNGMALGFYEENTNGHRVLTHGGDLNWFHSQLSLFMDDNIGIFISTNSAGNNKTDIRTDLLHDFADRYMPMNDMPMNATPGAVEPGLSKLHLRQVAGPYLVTRRSESSFLRLSNLVGEISLSAGENDTLLFNMPNMVKRFREINPYLWQEIDGKELLAVNVKDGAPVSMSLNSAAPVAEFEPVAPIHSATWILPAMLASLAVLGLTVVAYPIGLWIQRRNGGVAKVGLEQKRLFWAHGLASIFLIAGIGAWAVLIVPRVDSGFFETDNSQILLTQSLALACVSLAVVSMIVAARGMFKSKHTGLQKLGTLLWAFASVFVIWFYLDFNLLKFGVGL
jgi:CubicO group peptidase (beta-lactamase class C family)